MFSQYKKLLLVFITVLTVIACQPDSYFFIGSNPPEKERDVREASEPGSETTEPDSAPAEPNISVRPETVNASEHLTKPIVVMISIDGFRADYLQKYKPPTLLSWARNGVQAEGLVPSFPSLTFPNHVTLVTGRRPGNHGIVGNFFYDEKRKEQYGMNDSNATDNGSWYRGEPLWTVAEKSGMLSATFFWVGSEATIGGVDPTYMAHYNGKVADARRVQTVIEWLKLPAERRPHYIGLYFSEVDSQGHKYGPDADETEKAVLDIDKELAVLKKAIDSMNLNIQVIVVSDHGMKTIDHTVDISSATTLKGMATSGKGAVATFYSDDEAAIEKAYQELKQIPGPFKVYKGNSLPAHWELNDEDRRGDIVVVGDPGAYIGFQGFAPAGIGSSNKATHGWDARNSKDLHGLFIASGSAFKKGHKTGAFDNVHVYPIVLHVLSLSAQEPHDGDLREVKHIFRSKNNR